MQSKYPFLNFWLLWFSCVFLWIPTGKTEQLTFLPQWSPQAQFAGYYVAADKGFYRQKGIDVTILRGGPQNPASKGLRTKQAGITTLFLSTAIQNRAQGLKLVNLAQIVQKSGLLLVTKKSSGIKKPEDFEGKKISIWDDFYIQPQTFFKRYRLHVEIIPQSYTLNLFLRGGVDIASAMWYNEYHTILNSGYDEDELTTFSLDQYGINFPEDGIYTLEDTYVKNPSLCHNFVMASIEGWNYAFTHEEETLDIVMKHVNEANLPTNRVHQRWMLHRMKDIIQPPHFSDPMGNLLESDYNYVAKSLLEYKVIDYIPAYIDFIRRNP